MQTVSCSADADNTQFKIDRMAAGSVEPLAAYEAAQQAAKYCRDAIKEIPASSLDTIKSSEVVQIADDSKRFCTQAAKERGEAMDLAMAALDGDNSLAAAAKYKALIRKAKGNDISCRMSLEGLLEVMKVPASEFEFVKP